MATRRRRRRIGLRTRVISSFGLLSLLLSLGLSGATYFLVQASILERREATAINEAFNNARQVRSLLLEQQTAAAAGTDSSGLGRADNLLRRAPLNGIAVLEINGQITASARTVGNAPFDPKNSMPPRLSQTVGEHRAAIYRSHIKSEQVLIIAVPIQLDSETVAAALGATPSNDGATTTAASAGTTATSASPTTDAATTTGSTSADGTTPAPATAESWAAYYEVSSLADIDSTFNTMLIALTAAVGLTTLVGLLLGRWVSKRVLAPLSDVNDAVEALAEMSFDTKLPVTRDPDLAPLVSTFNHTVAALHERIERDGRFASDVSHELRSPLTTLTNSVAILERYAADLPSPAQQAVALLTEEFDRFQQLVGDLLEISRFDAGAQKLERSPLIIGEFVRHAIRMTCPDQDVPVTVDPDLEEAVIMADKRRLVQVLTNLTVNAAKYGGGVTDVNATRARGGVEIAVVDNGPGVPLADRIRVFDRFARGVSANKRGSTTGTGLGLALVAEHMRLHNGTVRVEDRLDGAPGARFVVYLPATPVSIYDTEADFEAAGIGADL